MTDREAIWRAICRMNAGKPIVDLSAISLEDGLAEVLRFRASHPEAPRPGWLLNDR